jgi:recombinase-like zinc beta ribbon protein/recombinase
VLKILTNPAVTGVFTPHIEEHRDGKLRRVPQESIADYYPRVIDDETFQRVQTLIGARKNTVRSGRVASIVAGLARCPKCGSTMTRVMKGTPKKGGIPKLVCTKAKAGAGCVYHGVRLPELERVLIENATTLGNPPAADNNLANTINGVSDALIELELHIESLVDVIERAPSAALSKRLAARETEAEKMRVDLKALQQQAADSESRVVNHRAKRLRECLSRLRAAPSEIAAANAALRECVESITVSYPTGQLLVKWRHGVSSSILFGWPTEV